MKSTNPTYFSDLNHEPQSDEHREAYIKSFSQQTGEQAGKLVADFLAGILFLLLVDRSRSSIQTLRFAQSDNYNSILEISSFRNPSCSIRG